MGPIERLVAVVGCQRSGTTLTGQLLGADPRALLVDEFDGLYPWYHALVDDGGSEADSRSLLARASSKYPRGDDRLSCDDAGLRLAPHVKTLVLKAPNLTFDEAKLAGGVLPASIVYPQRDPRAVVASMMRQDGIDFVANQLRLLAGRPAAATRYAAEIDVMSDTTIPQWIRQATLWQVKTGRVVEFKASGLHVHAFRYEDLIRHPEHALREIFDSCHLDDLPASMAAHRSYLGHGPGGTDRTRPVDDASLNLWGSTLSPAQAADVMQAAGPLAGQLGYA